VGAHVNASGCQNVRSALANEMEIENSPGLQPWVNFPAAHRPERATDDRDAGRPSKTTILFASFLGDRRSSLAPLQGASPIGRYPGLKMT
jgi:hypothetical protein